MFVKTIERPKTNGTRLSASNRKQRARPSSAFFGVLFWKYRILRNPSSLWYRKDMAYVMEACVSIHNTTLRERESGYMGTRKARVTASAAEVENAGATTKNALELLASTCIYCSSRKGKNARKHAATCSASGRLRYPLQELSRIDPWQMYPEINFGYSRTPGPSG